MTKRGNYVGVDILKPRAPTPEKLAEQDADERTEAFFNFDLSTLDGSANAMRPAGVLLGIKALFAFLVAASAGTQADWSQLGNTALDAVAYEAANLQALISITQIITMLWAIGLSVFVFGRSRVAAILAGLWVAIMWITKLASVAGGDWSSLLRGTVFLFLLTGAVALAIQGGISHHRLLKQDGAGAD